MAVPDSLKVVFGARYVLIFEFEVLGVNWTLKGVLKRSRRESIIDPFGNNLLKLWGRNRGWQ